MILGVSDEETSCSEHLERPLIQRTASTILYPWICCHPFEHSPPLLYQSLPSPNSIRLLRLHPGKQGTEIKSSLKLASLNSTLPSYEALSYVWGSTEGQKDIWLNGFKVKVNTNLYEALQRLRKNHRKRIIWVDALCINQEDSHEKGLQVGLMSYIYAHATKVLVWLGTDDYRQAENGFEILRAVADTRNKSKKRKSWMVGITKLGPKIEKEVLAAPPPLGSKAWIPVMALFTNIWFLRMWVLQEIVLARSGVFIWGATQLDWKIIESAISIIKSDSKLHAMLESRELQNAFFMSHLRKIRLDAMKSAHPFLHLLDLSRSFDVTEAEDKVYGLLGFQISIPSSSPESTPEIFIEPNYSSSIASIYTSVALKLIYQSGNLDVLSFAVHTSDELSQKPKDRIEQGGSRKGRNEKVSNGREAIPSWVPDWNSKTIIHPFAGFAPKSRHNTGTHRPLHILPTSSPAILSVTGVRLDTVSEVCAPVPFKNIHDLGNEVNRLVVWCSEREKISPSNAAPQLDNHTFSLAPCHFTESSIANVLTAGRQANGVLIEDPVRHTKEVLTYISQTQFELEAKGYNSRPMPESQIKLSEDESTRQPTANHHLAKRHSSPQALKDKTLHNARVTTESNTESNTESSSSAEHHSKTTINTPISTTPLSQQPPSHTKSCSTCLAPTTSSPPPNPDTARQAVFKATSYRSLLATASGNLGLGPGAMKEGDMVVALWGAQVPFVVRREEGEVWYRFVGECYIEEYMRRGAVEKLVVREGRAQEVFELR